MPEHVDSTVVPTADQVQRFRALSPAERYRWFAGLLRTTHGLASPETKERWQALKQAQSGGFLSTISTLAGALERGDFDAASRCLSPRCTYDASGTVLEGIDAVVGAYSVSHERVMRTMDRVRYRSRVDGVAPGVAFVTFDDHIVHRGKQHRHRRRHEMSVGRLKLVERIVHHDVAGEREALDAFCRSVGIPR